MVFGRKIIYRFYGFFLTVILMAACSNNNNGEIKTSIRGNFPAFHGKFVSLSEFDINKAIPIDTVKINDDGSFRFRFTRTGPGFYLLKIDNKNYITLVLNKEKRIEVYTELAKLRKDYHVNGSPDSELYHNFETRLEVNRNKVDSLARTYIDYQRSSHFRSIKLELDKHYQEIFADQRQSSIDFLENHCGSLASLLVINRRFGERKILTEEADFNYYILIDSCLSINFADNKHLLEHKRKIGLINEQRKITEMTEKRLNIGNRSPDIGLQDPSGKTIALHSLQGQAIILYFWASWDKVSRKANKMIKDMVDNARERKPAVYAIGLESYKEAWQNAINEDGIKDWINVTDYLNIHSSAKTMFNVPDKLPYFILLDKELIISYKGADFEELDLAIRQLTQ